VGIENNNGRNSKELGGSSESVKSLRGNNAECLGNLGAPLMRPRFSLEHFDFFSHGLRAVRKPSRLRIKLKWHGWQPIVAKMEGGIAAAVSRHKDGKEG
jgi:hypothetical protein